MGEDDLDKHVKPASSEIPTQPTQHLPERSVLLPPEPVPLDASQVLVATGQGLADARRRLASLLPGQRRSGKEDELISTTQTGGDRVELRASDVLRTAGRGLREAGQKAVEGASRTGKEVRLRTEETVVRIGENPGVQKAKEVAQKVKENPGQVATEAVLASRESRLRTEEENRKAGRLRRFFRTKAGWVLRTGIQMIPSPVGYGPGDLITFINFLFGQDIITGEKLDWVDRFVNLGASAFPFLPSTVLIPPAQAIRRGVENLIHAQQTGNSKEIASAINDLRKGVKGGKEAVRKPTNPK